MSRRACKRVSFNPNPEATDEPIFPKHDGLSSSHHSRRRVVLFGILSFGLRSSPAARKLIHRIGARFTKTLRFISFRRNATDRKTSSFLLPSSSSSSSSTIYMKRSKSVSETESHRAEAIEDCIEFLNSSFSLSRSNSVSTWSSWFDPVWICVRSNRAHTFSFFFSFVVMLENWALYRSVLNFVIFNSEKFIRSWLEIVILDLLFNIHCKPYQGF